MIETRNETSRIIAQMTGVFWGEPADNDLVEDDPGYLDIIVTTLNHDPADPESVTMRAYQRDMRVPFDHDRRFPRSILVEGLTRPAGNEEIRVAPDETPGWTVITIHPDRADQVPLMVKTDDVSWFLADIGGGGRTRDSA
ncbi:SsgA family sporulation/cell division regulator [Streptosporangium sp. NPDC051023]|uniref:SsgA family sporulation/cell division regulator n=1 Tax=Streptosporangium sp. NPDC051023 TaxID=3155410 RepID=UPI00344D1D2A